MDTPNLTVGDSLLVGQIPGSLVDLPKILPGTATINGPLCVGASIKEIPLANAMFGPGLNPGYQTSLASVGRTNIIGNLDVQALSNFTGITNKFGSTFKFALSLKNGVDIKQALNLGNGPTVFNGPVTVQGILTANGLINATTVSALNGIFKASLTAPTKHFNIPHPSRHGYRLVHTCLEGPENGVYYRGHLSNSNKIILPDYWNNLIDIETISVHLTPYKFHQELYVKSIEWGKIINIVNNNGGAIECDYIVYAERIDVEKLQVEIEDSGQL